MFGASSIVTSGKRVRRAKTSGTSAHISANIESAASVIEPKYYTGVLNTVKPNIDAYVAIIADKREPPDVLERLPEDTTVCLLDYGDYLFVTSKLSVGIERKTVSDLLNSIGDGRLDRQITGLCAEYDVPILLIQGELKPGRTGKVIIIVKGREKESGWNYNAVMNRLMTFQEYGIRLATCPDSTEWLIKRLNSLRSFYSLNEHSLKPRMEVPVGKSNYSASELALSQVHGIGLDRARKLHKHFGSLFAVVNATEKELRFVKGIGPKAADELYRTFRATEGGTTTFSPTDGFQPT